MSRTIRLRRAHALNWYGYKDTIPLEGNVLLAGVTGSGKSVLMDLIQYVLVGDQRLVRFNQSATGERSQRTLKGYCLGDTKQEDDGIKLLIEVTLLEVADHPSQGDADVLTATAKRHRVDAVKVRKAVEQEFAAKRGKQESKQKAAAKKATAKPAA